MTAPIVVTPLDHGAISERFNARFAATRLDRPTMLVGGAEEPVYLPARDGHAAIICYTRDYPRSALHELAHWCLASPEARELEDYGLGYLPPPRSVAEQQRFYAAEVPVQALEMLLCRACRIEFRFSADNPGADGGPDRLDFERRVTAAARTLLQVGPGAAAASVLDLFDPHWRRWECGIDDSETRMELQR